MNKQNPITLSCYYKSSREGENYVVDDVLQFQLSGLLILYDGKKAYPSAAGGLRLVRRNRLMKYFKEPEEQRPFQALSIHFDLDFLKTFALDYPVVRGANGKAQEPVIDLKTNLLIEGYLKSILDFEKTGALKDPAMADAKLREGLLLILKSNPQLAAVLFDFSQPYKIGLREFMEENYAFNVKIDRFAYLTGRSLATFKRDFQSEFGVSPRRWLTTRRLEQAYKILSTPELTVSDIYMDLGFEGLSHFSHAFKRKYGVAPTHFQKLMTSQG